jgi:hypothetical protein
VSAPLHKAGPIAYCLTSIIVYGLMINCGDKPTLSRISSKCRTAEAADQSASKKNSTGTDANKKTTKSAALTSSQDDDALGQEAGEASELSGLTGYDDFSEDSESLGLADDAETFYDSNVKAIIEGKCVNCHPKVAPPPLDSYANVKKVSNDVLRTMKSTDPKVVMPPGDGRLPEADIAKVAEWVKLLSAPTTGGGSTSTSTSKGKSNAPGTGSSKNTSSTANATKDECKASNATPGTSTSSSTAKSTGTKSGTGTSTGKK